MEEKIREFIKQKKSGVSFVELERLDGVRGDFAWVDQTKNLVFWDGLSNEFLNAIESLIKKKEVAHRTTSKLVYFIDGRVLTLPIARSTNRKYKTQRWLPSAFDWIGDA